MRLFTLASTAAGLFLVSALAHARQPGPTTCAGPGRITCKITTTCEVGIGAPVTLKFQVGIEALPVAGKDCMPNGETLCREPKWAIR
jgi:hypothetical protein